MKLLIVPDERTPLGTLRAVAEADIVVTVTGVVLKDRHNDTFVRSLVKPPIPEHPADVWHREQEAAATLNLREVSAGAFNPPGGEIGKGSILGESDTTRVRGRHVKHLIEGTLSAGGGRLLMNYTDARGDDSERIIRPSKLEHRRSVGSPFGEDYVVCYDEQSDEVRTFRLDRVNWMEEAPPQ